MLFSPHRTPGCVLHLEVLVVALLHQRVFVRAHLDKVGGEDPDPARGPTLPPAVLHLAQELEHLVSLQLQLVIVHRLQMFFFTTRLHMDCAAHLVGEQHPALLLGPQGHPGPGLGRGAGGGGRQHLDKATVTIKTTNISEPPLRLVATTTTTHCPCPYRNYATGNEL